MRRHGWLSPRRRFDRAPAVQHRGLPPETRRRKAQLVALQQRRGLLPAECSELLDILHPERAS